MPAKNLLSFEEPDSTAFGREMRELIARQLKANYDLAEPLPDRLSELLRQFAQRAEEGGSEQKAEALPNHPAR